MEDHLRNKDRLQKEWEALCSYQAESSSVSIAQSESNMEKNRYPDFVPCKSSVPFKKTFIPFTLQYDLFKIN